MKALTDAQIAFKAAVRRAVKFAGGPNAAQDVVRVDASRLSRYGNTDAPEFAPIDVCFELDKAAGEHLVLKAWADMCGFELTPRSIDKNAARDLTVAAGQVAKESGELISSAIEAAHDGQLTPTEAKRVDGEAADLEGKIVQLRTVTRAVISGAA